MKKICLIGGPSSGKTTAAFLLSVRLKMMGYEVQFIPECATTYINEVGAPANVFEQIAIFYECIEKEALIEKKGSFIDFLVCETASFITCVYARQYPPRRDASEDEIRKYNYVLTTLERRARGQILSSYDFVFFLPLEIPFKKGSVRWQNDEAEARKISDEIESYLRLEGKKYYRISGSPEERVSQIMAVLELTKK